METLLSFSKVSKRYQSGDFWRPIKAQALKDVSFEVGRGEVFGLIGLNGAGKTTLMKAAVGLLWPDEGEIRLFGSSVHEVAVRGRFGYLPELPYFPKYLSAWEVLLFYGRLHGLRGQVLKSRCEETLRLVGLWQAAREPLSRYSKGMQQRVGLAQTLIHRPEMVFLDEPLSGLDPSGAKEMRDVILGLHQEGKTVFFNSHSLSEVERICDRVGIMHQGRMLVVANVAELISAYASNVTLGLAGLDGEALRKVQGLQLHMRQEGSVWTLEAPHQHLAEVLGKLKEAGAAQPSILSLGSPLETAFLALTGEAGHA
jgi:ABC-2 type transport system ATP-binding protein